MQSRTFHLKRDVLAQAETVKAIAMQYRNAKVHLEDLQSEFRFFLAQEMAHYTMPTLYVGTTSIDGKYIGGKTGTVYKYEKATVFVTVDEIAVYKLPELREFLKDRLTFVFRPCKANGHRNPYALPKTFTLLELRRTKAFQR